LPRHKDGGSPQAGATVDEFVAGLYFCQELTGLPNWPK